MALLRYYSQNICIDDFSESERKEIARVLAAADYLASDGNNIEDTANGEKRHIFKNDRFEVTVATPTDKRYVSYDVMIEVDWVMDFVFSAILLKDDNKEPTYTVTCYRGGDWASELWNIALEESNGLKKTSMRFGEL